ncbi:MAG: hypothetical protein IT378_18535 [Sandaracinaceae bacterium]|nr:hypothetical protein [Sandaracinaceae bacterium]
MGRRVVWVLSFAIVGCAAAHEVPYCEEGLPRCPPGCVAGCFDGPPRCAYTWVDTLSEPIAIGCENDRPFTCNADGMVGTEDDDVLRCEASALCDCPQRP